MPYEARQWPKRVIQPLPTRDSNKGCLGGELAPLPLGCYRSAVGYWKRSTGTTLHMIFSRYILVCFKGDGKCALIENSILSLTLGIRFAMPVNYSPFCRRVLRTPSRYSWPGHGSHAPLLQQKQPPLR